MAVSQRNFLAFVLLAAVSIAGCTGDGGGQDGGDGSPSGTPSPSASASVSLTASASSSSTSSTASPAPTPRPAQTFDVDIEGNDFVDGSLTVQKGDTVRWTQRDVAQHTVTADGGSFDSGTLTLVAPTFTFKFDAVGSFPYHCEVHGSMTDTITVVAALP